MKNTTGCLWCGVGEWKFCNELHQSLYEKFKSNFSEELNRIKKRQPTEEELRKYKKVRTLLEGLNFSQLKT